MYRFDDRVIPALSAALATAVTLLKELAGWLERTSLMRKQQSQMEHALVLSRFLERLGSVEKAGASPGMVAEVRTKTQAELNNVLGSIADVLDEGYAVQPATARLSVAEQLFLAYRPVGWSARIAHFLFYSSGLITLFILLGSAADELGNWSYAALRSNWRDSDTIIAFVLYLIVAAITNRWAIAERKARRFVYETKPGKYPNEKWVAMLAFIAYLSISVLAILILPFSGYSGEQPRVFWTRRVVASFAAGVAYTWMRGASENRVRARWHWPRTRTQWMASISLAATTLWYLACSVRPSLIVPNIGQSETVDRILAAMIFAIIPWLCCFRLTQAYLGSVLKPSPGPSV